MAFRDRAHRVGKRGEHWSAVRWIERLRPGVTVTEGADEVLFDGRSRGCVLLCPVECVPRNLRTRFGHDRQVVVRADRQRDAPVAHRARRIERRGLGKRPRRLVVVEGPEQPHALIEIPLRLWRRGRDSAVKHPEAIENLRAARPVGDGLRSAVVSSGVLGSRCRRGRRSRQRRVRTR